MTLEFCVCVISTLEMKSRHEIHNSRRSPRGTKHNNTIGKTHENAEFDANSESSLAVPYIEEVRKLSKTDEMRNHHQVEAQLERLLHELKDAYQVHIGHPHLLMPWLV